MGTTADRVTDVSRVDPLGAGRLSEALAPSSRLFATSQSKAASLPAGWSACSISTDWTGPAFIGLSSADLPGELVHLTGQGADRAKQVGAK